MSEEYDSSTDNELRDELIDLELGSNFASQEDEDRRYVRLMLDHSALFVELEISNGGSTRNT